MTIRRRLLRSFGALAVASSVFSLPLGCESLGLGNKGNGDNKDADRTRDRDPDRPQAGDGARPGRASIPPDARKVREGAAGERVAYRADRDGRVYALDVDDDRVVYGGPLRRDDELALDPAGDRADLNGRPAVTATRLGASHKHNLYFQPD